jgi:pimeloyl-ACP methyl ester carboxylesterase
MTGLSAPNCVRHVCTPTNGIHLHCAVSGSGPLLLMLHGFPEFWRSWESQIPSLASRFTVVVPDLRGFEDSAKPRTGYDTVTLALDILGVPPVADLFCLRWAGLPIATLEAA